MNILSFIINYFQRHTSKIIDIYRKLQKDDMVYLYRLVKISQGNNQEILLSIQVVNSSAVFTARPKEIAGDDNFIKDFSPKDIRAIIYLACEELKKPKYRIVMQNFYNKFENSYLVVEEKGSKKKLITTASEISENDYIIQELDSRDAHLIGFLTANEQSIKENNIKNELLDQIKNKK